MNGAQNPAVNLDKPWWNDETFCLRAERKHWLQAGPDVPQRIFHRASRTVGEFDGHDSLLEHCKLISGVQDSSFRKGSRAFCGALNIDGCLIFDSKALIKDTSLGSI